MGVYELARAAASRCAARIEELPVFRLAWSERGAPRRGLPVFRLAWSERGAPRRSCAAGGAPGAPGVCMRRRPAGAANAVSRPPQEWSRDGAESTPGTRARCACPERANAMLGAAVPALPKACSDRPAIRREGFRPDFPGLPGMGGAGLKMSTFTRRAGGTTFLRHVHLKAGIEVPRARLLHMKTVRPRCPPGKNAGPAPRSPRLPRGHGHAVCRRMHSRTKVTSAGGHVITSRTRPKNPFYRVKPEPDQTDFLGQSATS